MPRFYGHNNGGNDMEIMINHWLLVVPLNQTPSTRLSKLGGPGRNIPPRVLCCRSLQSRDVNIFNISCLIDL